MINVTLIFKLSQHLGDIKKRLPNVVSKDAYKFSVATELPQLPSVGIPFAIEMDHHSAKSEVGGPLTIITKIEGSVSKISSQPKLFVVKNDVDEPKDNWLIEIDVHDDGITKTLDYEELD